MPPNQERIEAPVPVPGDRNFHRPIFSDDRFLTVTVAMVAELLRLLASFVPQMVGQLSCEGPFHNPFGQLGHSPALAQNRLVAEPRLGQ